MNPIALDIRLRDHFPSGREDVWGSAEGLAVREKLVRVVDAHPEATIIRISLEGVRKIDGSAARESVMELAYQLRGRRGICLMDVSSRDVLENLNNAALVRGQTLVVWSEKGPQLIGPRPSEDTWDLLKFVLKKGDVTTAEAAKVLRKQVNNVSTRLKRLTEEGLVLRRDVNASTGGLEYRYLAIR